jgi:hypothetical protein
MAKSGMEPTRTAPLFCASDGDLSVRVGDMLAGYHANDGDAAGSGERCRLVWSLACSVGSFPCVCAWRLLTVAWAIPGGVSVQVRTRVWVDGRGRRSASSGLRLFDRSAVMIAKNEAVDFPPSWGVGF